MKTTVKTRPFDAAEFLGSEESIAAFVGDALESGDPTILQNALNTAARARGMTEIAEASGLGRESLYKALRPDATPRFDTIVKVMGALGVKVTVQPIGLPARSAPAVRATARAVKAVKVISAEARPVKTAKRVSKAAKAGAKRSARMA